MTFTPNDKYDIIDDVLRVEEKCDTLQTELNALFGLSLNLTFKTDWARDDLPTVENMERIRSNIQTLVGLVADYTLDVFGNTFLYTNANQFETAFDIIDEYIIHQAIQDKAMAGFYVAGEPINLMAERN